MTEKRQRIEIEVAFIVNDQQYKMTHTAMDGEDCFAMASEIVDRLRRSVVPRIAKP